MTHPTGSESSALVTVDLEFQTLIPPLAPEERAQLEENILTDGCLDPLKVWKADGKAIAGIMKELLG